MSSAPDLELDVVVIGAGVVGLACAAALARSGRSVVILERHDGIVRETSSRNSEVVHAGIYNPVGSLKSTLCIAGRHELVERCLERGIPYKKVGKLIVAPEPEGMSRLEEIFERGQANGVEGLRWLAPAEVKRREPSVKAAAAIESPETGIVDGVAYARSFLAEAEQYGAVTSFCSEVVQIEPVTAGYRVAVRSGAGSSAEMSSVAASCVVNAAGLGGDRVAALAGIDIEHEAYQLQPCKGDYFSLAPGSPISFSQLIYPLPEAAGLGIHATLDLDGRIRFGPDATYVEELALEVDPGKGDAFYEAIRSYVPSVQRDWLVPDFAGIRPKLAGPEDDFRDFVISEEARLGLPGFVNLLGIESPGLTASAAIAVQVAELLSSI